MRSHLASGEILRTDHVFVCYGFSDSSRCREKQYHEVANQLDILHSNAKMVREQTNE